MINTIYPDCQDAILVPVGMINTIYPDCQDAILVPVGMINTIYPDRYSKWYTSVGITASITVLQDTKLYEFMVQQPTQAVYVSIFGLEIVFLSDTQFAIAQNLSSFLLSEV